MPTRPYLSDAEADAVVAAARRAAEELGVPVTIAIVDDGANLLRLVRLDGAPLVSIEVAIGKARTAARIRIATAMLEEGAKTSPAVLAISDAMPFAGGYPLVSAGAHLGGLGVSGGAPEDDVSIAVAAMERGLPAA